METAYIIITVLLTLLGFAAGVGAAHRGILRGLNQVKTEVAVQKEVIGGLRSSEQKCLDIHQETLGLVKEVISQNSLLINQLITHSEIQPEHRR